MEDDLFQVVAKALVTNQSGRVLLIGSPHRNARQWDVPGGIVRAKESFSSALERGWKEEVGVGLQSDPSQCMTLVAEKINSIEPSQYELLLVLFAVKLAVGCEPDPQEKDNILEWVEPTVAAERLLDSYPEELCAAVASMGLVR